MNEKKVSLNELKDVKYIKDLKEKEELVVRLLNTIPKSSLEGGRMRFGEETYPVLVAFELASAELNRLSNAMNTSYETRDTFLKEKMKPLFHTIIQQILYCHIQGSDVVTPTSHSLLEILMPLLEVDLKDKNRAYLLLKQLDKFAIPKAFRYVIHPYLSALKPHFEIGGNINNINMLDELTVDTYLLRAIRCYLTYSITTSSLQELIIYARSILPYIEQLNRSSLSVLYFCPLLKRQDRILQMTE